MGRPKSLGSTKKSGFVPSHWVSQVIGFFVDLRPRPLSPKIFACGGLFNNCLKLKMLHNYYKFNIVLSRLNCGIEITVTFKTSDNSLRLTDLLMAWAWGSCRSDPSCKDIGVEPGAHADLIRPVAEQGSRLPPHRVSQVADQGSRLASRRVSHVPSHWVFRSFENHPLSQVFGCPTSLGDYCTKDIWTWGSIFVV